MCYKGALFLSSRCSDPEVSSNKGGNPGAQYSRRLWGTLASNVSEEKEAEKG